MVDSRCTFICSRNSETFLHGIMSYNYDHVSSSSESEEETFDLNVGDLRPYDFEPVPRNSVTQQHNDDAQPRTITNEERRKGTQVGVFVENVIAWKLKKKASSAEKLEKSLTIILAT